jgi:hypothetical protein
MQYINLKSDLLVMDRILNLLTGLNSEFHYIGSVFVPSSTLGVQRVRHGHAQGTDLNRSRISANVLNRRP